MKRIGRVLAPVLIPIAAILAIAAITFPAQAQRQFSNTLAILGANAGGTPSIRAQGTDTNISINLVPKGTGCVEISGVCISNTSVPGNFLVGGNLTVTGTSLFTGAATAQGGLLQPFGTTATPTSSLKLSPVRIFDNVTATATAGTGTETIYTYTLPASALAVNGQGLKIVYYASILSTGNKQGTITFGATTIMDTTAAGFAAGATMTTECWVYRTGATAQTAICKGMDGVSGALTNNASTNTWTTLSNPAETLSGTVAIVFTGQSATAGRWTGQFASIDWYPQGQ